MQQNQATNETVPFYELQEPMRSDLHPADSEERRRSSIPPSDGEEQLVT